MKSFKSLTFVNCCCNYKWQINVIFHKQYNIFLCDSNPIGWQVGDWTRFRKKMLLLLLKSYVSADKNFSNSCFCWMAISNRVLGRNIFSCYLNFEDFKFFLLLYWSKTKLFETYSKYKVVRLRKGGRKKHF